MWETDQSAPCSSSGSQPNLSDSLVWSTGETPGEGALVTMVRTRSAEDIRCVLRVCQQNFTNRELSVVIYYSLYSYVVLKFDVLALFLTNKKCFHCCNLVIETSCAEKFFREKLRENC